MFLSMYINISIHKNTFDRVFLVLHACDIVCKSKNTKSDCIVQEKYLFLGISKNRKGFFYGKQRKFQQPY